MYCYVGIRAELRKYTRYKRLSGKDLAKCEKGFSCTLINIQTSFEGSKKDLSFSAGAANYAWSTGRDGNCTAFAPCWYYEYHINGDIVKGFIDYRAASGDGVFFNESLLPIMNSIATFFSDLVQLNQSTGTWELTNMTDPDEYASFVNNGAYTNGPSIYPACGELFQLHV
jgi:hypothetical protein